MSLVLVNQIIYEDTVYKCYYDTGTGNGSVVVTGSNPQTFIPFPNAQNSGHEGDVVNQFCSDNPSTTLVKILLNQTTPFFTSQLTPNSPTCVVGPTPGCDLNIVSLDKTNQSGIGLNDGTVLINASTTGGSIQYSLDATTYQSSNSFSGLAPGNYTAYAKDERDCIDTQPFTIQPFINPVQNLQDDLPVIDLGGGNISRWNAAYNPIVINYQRRDFNVTSIVQGASAQQIKVNLDTTLTFDQYNPAVTKGLYLKTAMYVFSGVASGYSEESGYGVFTIQTPFLGNDTIGFVNVPDTKPGYYIETRIKYGLDPLNQKTITAIHSADNNNGKVRADLAPFLQTLVNAKDNYNYSDQSYTDIDRCASYQVSFREGWDTGVGDYFNAPYPLYVVNAAWQLGEQYGGNMANYTPFFSNHPAKFLTDWQRPFMWSGLPFEIAFIYSENVINKQLYIELTPNCGDIVNGYLLNADAGYVLNADLSRFVIQRLYNDNIQGFPVIKALGLTRVLIPDVFDCCATQITANIYFQDGGAPATFAGEVTEQSGSDFVDVNLQFKLLGTEVWTLNSTGSKPAQNVEAGTAYTFIAFVQNTPVASDPKMSIVVYKDDVPIYSQSIAGAPGNQLIKQGIAQPGAVYRAEVVGCNGCPDVAVIDIPDNSPVETTKNYVMQTLTIRHECPCEDPYIYLKWLNSKGGWDYYRFGFNQAEQSNVSNDQAVKRFIFDWQNDETLEDVINKSAINTISVGADQVDKDTFNALEWARKSIHAMILVSQNPVKWRTVVIKDGDTSAKQSRKPLSSVRMQLVLPSTNIQAQ